MSILVVRHGLSHANNRAAITTPVFSAEQAPLMAGGRAQARIMGKFLIDTYHLLPSDTPVATSTLLRAQQTAVTAGFTDIQPYAQLDEVPHGMPLPELRALLDNGRLPKIALQQAEQTLAHPPKESVWITHGLRIAALCALLDVHQDERPIPHFCEVRELPINTR